MHKFFLESNYPPTRCCEIRQRNSKALNTNPPGRGTGGAALLLRAWPRSRPSEWRKGRAADFPYCWAPRALPSPCLLTTRCEPCWTSWWGRRGMVSGVRVCCLPWSVGSGAGARGGAARQMAEVRWEAAAAGTTIPEVRPSRCQEHIIIIWTT